MSTETDIEVDPRITRTRQVVLAATIEELTAVGFERISIDAIAERSGVARSTIYRNWPDRTALLAEAFRSMMADGPAGIAPADSLRQDLENLARFLIAQLTSDRWQRTLPSLVSAALHDESMADLLGSLSGQRAAEARAILERAVARGELTETGGSDGKLDHALERFVAPFFFRRLVSQRPLDDAFVEAQVSATIHQLGGQTSSQTSPRVAPTG